MMFVFLENEHATELSSSPVFPGCGHERRDHARGGGAECLGSHAERADQGVGEFFRQAAIPPGRAEDEADGDGAVADALCGTDFCDGGRDGRGAAPGKTGRAGDGVFGGVRRGAKVAGGATAGPGVPERAGARRTCGAWCGRDCRRNCGARWRRTRSTLWWRRRRRRRTIRSCRRGRGSDGCGWFSRPRRGLRRRIGGRGISGKCRSWLRRGSPC